jgi:uncharacterized membrane protein
MTDQVQESHTRSILKGISWRLVATVDTILVVLFVTCLMGECSLEVAGMIAGIEFIFKLLIYYFHERLWQLYKKSKVVTKKRTLLKSLSWRGVATTSTFFISGYILDSFDEVALGIAITELFTKFALYYFHERIWLKVPLGMVRKKFSN